MAIGIKEVEHVAGLAKLCLDEDEKKEYAKKLSEIVDYMEILNEVDVEDVEPTYHILPLKNVFREDEIKPSMEREKVLMNAGDTEDGCFKVPRMIE